MRNFTLQITKFFLLFFCVSFYGNAQSSYTENGITYEIDEDWIFGTINQRAVIEDLPNQKKVDIPAFCKSKYQVYKINTAGVDKGLIEEIIIGPNVGKNIGLLNKGGIDDKAFVECTGLISFDITSNSNFSVADGVLYNSGKTILKAYPAANKRTTFEIPKTVTSLGDYCTFSKNLESVFFKGSKVPSAKASSFDNIDKGKCILYVTNSMLASFNNSAVWKAAFKEIRVDGERVIHVETAGTLQTQITNTGLDIKDVIKLTVSGVLNSTDILTLRSMTGSDVNGKVLTTGSLKYLDMSDCKIVSGGVVYLNKNIGTDSQVDIKDTNHKTFDNQFPHYAFYNCPRLETIIIPLSVTSIGNSAFKSCSNLKNVTLLSDATKIYHNAFRSVSGVTSFTIPKNVVEIDNDAFVNTGGNQNFKVEAGNMSFTSIDGVLYSKNKKEIVAFPAGRTGKYTVAYGTETIRSCAFSFSSLSEVEMQLGVKTIQEWAFEHNSFSKMTIPSSVTAITKSVFLKCNSILHLYVLSSIPPAVANDGHDIDRSKCKLYVPSGAKTAYKEAEYWKEFIKTGLFVSYDNIIELEDEQVSTAGKLEQKLLNANNNSEEKVLALKSITVNGEMNSTDVKFLRKLAQVGSLTKLDLYNCNVVAGGDPYLIQDNVSYTTAYNDLGALAFSNTKLISVILPKTSSTIIHTDMFDGCKNLCAIRFANCPDNFSDKDIVNFTNRWDNNTLVIYDNGLNMYDLPANIIAADNMSYSEVNMRDKKSYLSPWDNLQVSKCTFTKEFGKRTEKGQSLGWETIILPFKPTVIKGKNKNGTECNLIPFKEGQYDVSSVPYTCLFWLRKLTVNGYEDVSFDEIEPNTPYLISMPNDPCHYNNKYNIEGEIKFIAEAEENHTVTLFSTVMDPERFYGPGVANDGNPMSYDMSFTYNNYTIPDEEKKTTYLMNEAGDAFELVSDLNGREVNPFEAYALRKIGTLASSALRRFSMDNQYVETDILDIMMDKNSKEGGIVVKSTYGGVLVLSESIKDIRIYSADGRMVKSILLNEGENFIPLDKGIYLIDTIKFVH